MSQSDTPKPEDIPQPSPGGAGPEMEKIPDDPERDPRFPPATRRTTEVDREQGSDGTPEERTG